MPPAPTPFSAGWSTTTLTMLCRCAGSHSLSVSVSCCRAHALASLLSSWICRLGNDAINDHVPAMPLCKHVGTCGRSHQACVLCRHCCCAGVCHVAARRPEPCRSPTAEGRRQVMAQSRGWPSEAATAPGQRLEPRHAGPASGPGSEAAQPRAGAGEQLLSADQLVTASRQTLLASAWRHSAEGVQHWRGQPSGAAASELMLQACQRQTFCDRVREPWSAIELLDQE